MCWCVLTCVCTCEQVCTYVPIYIYGGCRRMPGVLLCHSPAFPCFAAMLAGQKAPMTLSYCLGCRCAAWLLQRCVLESKLSPYAMCGRSYTVNCLPSLAVEYLKASGKLEFFLPLSCPHTRQHWLSTVNEASDRHMAPYLCRWITFS